MRGLARLRTAALAAAFVAVIPAAARANCGAENCPLNPQGLESASGSWSFDLGFQYIDQDRQSSGGHSDEAAEPGHAIERFTRTKTWSLNTRAQVLPWLRLTATLPYLQREHAHDEEHHPGVFETFHWKYEGLGDATMLAHWTAWGSADAGAGVVTVLSGVKVPTGKRHVEEIEGEEPEPSARPGTGSTDLLAGLQVMRHFQVGATSGREVTLPIVVSVMGRWNGKGTEGYRIGDEVHTSFSTGYAVWPKLSLLTQVNAVFHGRDDAGDTHAEPEHTGGTSVFVAPGLRAEVGGGVSVYGYWQARVYERTNGHQLVAPSHLIIGTSFGLGR